MPFFSRLPAIALLFLALPASARTLEVGPGRQFALPSQAAAVAQDGDKVVIAPGQYFDCAVWRQNNLTVEGVSAQDTVITDKSCQGKALFVIPGNNVTVRNLTLTRARVPDGNGAGIRAEGRNLLVERVRFIENQNGILAADQPTGEIIVRDSEFLRNGTCEQACAHGIYANRLALLRVERSTFRETRQGHHIKSRAARTEVLGCDITDGPAGTASYLVDVPNGGAVVIQNSRFEKGPKAENHSAAISIGAEGVDRPTPEIRVEGNRFSADGAYATAFVVNLTATAARLRDNHLRGQVRPLRGDGEVLP
jgi:hypothetical protein